MKGLQFREKKCTHKRTHMKSKQQYKVRHIRMSDEVWEELKNKRRKSGFNWNGFIKQLDLVEPAQSHQ